MAQHSGRRLQDILKRLIDVVTDRTAAMHPYLWANHVVALGKLVDGERDAVLTQSVLHNIGQRRTALLHEFIAHWDAIEVESVLGHMQ